MAPTWSHLANPLQIRRFPGIYLVPLALTYPSISFVGSEEVRRNPCCKAVNFKTAVCGSGEL